MRKIVSNNPLPIHGIKHEKLYYKWIKKNEPGLNELETQKNTRFHIEPKISIIVTTFNTPRQYLIEMIDSVINQTYSNWELCLAVVGAGREIQIHKMLETYAKKDNRIQVKFLSENKGIAKNANEALSLATGDFAALLDHNDTLAPFALFEIVKVINEHPDVNFIYSDEDMITENGKKRVLPHFKPDWSPDTLRSYNYITHFTVIKQGLLGKIRGFREGYDGSQDYDLMLRATENVKEIIHIAKILYHHRVPNNSDVGNMHAKSDSRESAKKALEDHIKRTGLKGRVEDGLFLFSYKINYTIDAVPRVSIIIPNKDNAGDLEKCIKAILGKSTYRNFEIIIIENGSSDEKTFRLYDELTKLNNVRLIEWNKPFNYSMINNFAVNSSEGDVLLFCNNDTEVINHDWIERMLEHALRKEVGAVGAKLYYPSNTIQHAGIILGVGIIAGHSHKYFPQESNGYFGRLKVVQNLSAVTGACLMIRKNVFEELEGFDERFVLAFNDVDLCLKLRDKGYLIIFTPYAELYHHESKTRGDDNTLKKQIKFRVEIKIFQDKWRHILELGDPYYSPNLTLLREDFSIKI
ncbi:MAG: glycosyltransferase family 2 protein [Candidatus Scalindua sp.]|nr:glycosyltransferase family 2 protein [Candidatus Scalindua sp.]